jgi:hypothetical protein
MSTGPNMGICSNQDEFNKAFRKAIRKTDEDIEEEISPYRNLYILLFIIFFIWALVLAMKMPSGNDKIVNLVLAMAFSPLYVIAYYVREFNGEN